MGDSWTIATSFLHRVRGLIVGGHGDPNQEKQTSRIDRNTRTSSITHPDGWQVDVKSSHHPNRMGNNVQKWSKHLPAKTGLKYHGQHLPKPTTHPWRVALAGEAVGIPRPRRRKTPRPKSWANSQFQIWMSQTT